MTNKEAIEKFKKIKRGNIFLIHQRIEGKEVIEDYSLCDMAISALQAQDLQSTCNQLATDCISRQAAIETSLEFFVEFLGGAFYKNSQKELIARFQRLPSAQPERTCVNCGRTANNGGWYADGRTRCPIEEHYALPKDGYCHLWEKRNVTDDDYPERQKNEQV